MAAQHLFENYGADAWDDANEGAQRTVGMKWISPDNGDVTALRYRKVSATNTHHPAKLILWAVDSRTPVAVVATVPDVAGTGWQDVALGASYHTTGNVRYLVSALWPANTHRSQRTSVGMGLPTPPLFWGADSGSFTSANVDAYPETDATNQFAHGVDLSWESDGTQPAAGTGDLANQFAAWLISTGDNTHQIDGLPWLIKAELAATKALVEAIPAVAGTDWGKVSSIWDLAGDLTAPEFAIIRAFFETAQPVRPEVEPWATTAELSVATDALQDQIDGLAGVVDQHLDALLLRERLDLSVDVDNLDRWRLVGTADGEGDGFVDMQADRYTVEWVQLPPKQPQHLIADHWWAPHAGWCAPVRGGYVGPRRYLDFLLNDVRWAPYLMHGLLIYSHPGAEWLVGAWVLDRPA